MEIIATNIENLAENKKALYQLTKAPGVNVKDLEPDVSHPVAGWALYKDMSNGRDGTVERNVLAVILEDGTKIQTISNTFIRAFMEIVELMQNDPFSIITRKSTSKAGREFVTCDMDCT